jgi:protein TonB
MAMIAVFALHGGLVFWLYKTRIEAPAAPVVEERLTTIQMATLDPNKPPPPKPEQTVQHKTINLHRVTTVVEGPQPQALQLAPDIKTVDPDKQVIVDPTPPEPVHHVISRPNWERTPDGDQFTQYYPDRAMRLGKEGSVKLDCLVRANGTLTQCAVGSETPEGYGFGEATQKIARYFRMTPQQEDGKAVEGGAVSVRVQWKLPK